MIKITRIIIDDDEPVYGIGVVSRLTNLPVWTLRILDKRAVVTPKKSKGNTRLYSNRDLQLLCRVHYLLKVRKVNVSGLCVMKELKKLEEEE